MCRHPLMLQAYGHEYVIICIEVKMVQDKMMFGMRTDINVWFPIRAEPISQN